MSINNMFRRNTSLLPIKQQSRFSTELSEISLWKHIYAGGGNWRYARKGGIEGGMRRINSLGAAKALCAELSALCFSEQADFGFMSKASPAPKEIGEFVSGVLQDNGFWRCFPLFLEKMFALGSGVIKVYCENNEVKLNYIGGDKFIPTQYDEKGVYGGIIISCLERDGRRFELYEKHEKSGIDYIITNTLFDIEKDKQIELKEVFPNLQKETRVKNLKKSLFVYFRPASVNNIGDTPLGISVLANAADILKSLDIVFDSLEREFVLGKKRIIVPVSAIKGEYGDDGKLHRFFDTGDEVYQAFSANDREELKIVDNSSELRVSEHVDALEELLDLLCMQAGLSPGALSYKSSGARTATEVLSQGTRTHRTKTAHQQLIREGLTDLLGNIILLGKITGALPFTLNDDECKVNVVFADSVMQDNSARIDNAVKLFKAGIIDKNRALMEVYGLSGEEVHDE
ncbi:MAG: phage portal protein [Oscillospiraceae bacterium]|jgi:A118 family predicted phage portal protein|nr:phage portal protein [Oscillospiraceae bacterium]